MTRFRSLYVAPTVLLLVLAAWPLIRGSGTLYTRDVLTSHYPMKAAQAEYLRNGELPLIDLYRAGGQPLLGNPNALPLYPDNLLYLVASPLWALNAHFWLHLLLAPLGFYWLGRAWGLSRPAAWAGGVFYVASGFFLSLLNLYNLVAGAALAPALVAALLDTWSSKRAALKRAAVSAVAFGALWALMLLAGDPMFAAMAMLLAVVAVLIRHARGGWSGGWRSRLGLTVASMLCGTLIAAPMLIEMARILPLSFRGYWQFSMQAALSQSWDPRSVLEWLLPFFFGRPDFSFWGMRYYGGNPPLLYSLYPGLLALALIVLGGWPRHRAAVWSWLFVTGGLFLAAGAWNPVVRLLYALPGASALRYPVKLWLWVAVGAALLCALGFERLLAGERRRLARVFAVLAAFYLGLLVLLAWAPPFFTAWLHQLDPQRLNAATLAREMSRWTALCVLTLVVLALFGLVLILARRRPHVLGAALLGVHLLSQGFFLDALYDSDGVENYEPPAELLSAVPEGATVVHGGFRDLFGPPQVSPLTAFPDPRFFWLARLQARELYPFAGIPEGRRYELNHSPEGLDTFFGVSLARAFRGHDDLQRVRLLAASGVDTLILNRELDAPARPAADLETTYPSAPNTVYVYRLRQAAPEVLLAGTVLRAPQMNQALATMASADFDPRSMVVLPGAGAAVSGTPGRAELVEESTEELVVDVASDSGGVLLTRRAFLGTYRVTIDGEAAVPAVGNLQRLAVEVPAGEHRVRFWIDRGPTRIGWLAALCGVVGLLVMGRRKAVSPTP